MTTTNNGEQRARVYRALDGVLTDEDWEDLMACGTDSTRVAIRHGWPDVAYAGATLAAHCARRLYPFKTTAAFEVVGMGQVVNR